jgi:hypothetical protein
MAILSCFTLAPRCSIQATSNPAQELAASVTEETSLPDELDMLNPAAQDSSHAIVPDTPEVTAPSPPAEATAPSTDLPQLPSADSAIKEASPSVTSQPVAPAPAKQGLVHHNAKGRACDDNFGGNYT